MKIKKKLIILLTIITIITSLSTVAIAGSNCAPPLPIRDSIVQTLEI
ncbi:hypothetical protein K8M07_08655 [Schnuerera sp. xch1]|nr:hypothetical protein [Schnuerera sp. xch1]MBZ2175317.1 hypothetical protein [Schnuerera sp. xch1]